MAQSKKHENPSKIIGIQFSVLSPDEIRKASVANIVNRDTYINLRTLDLLRNTMKSMGQTEEAQELEEIFLQHYSVFQN